MFGILILFTLAVTFDCVLFTPWNFLFLYSIKVYASGSPHSPWNSQSFPSSARIFQPKWLANIHWKYQDIGKWMNQISGICAFSNKVECHVIWTHQRIDPYIVFELLSDIFLRLTFKTGRLCIFSKFSPCQELTHKMALLSFQLPLIFIIRYL